MGLTLDFSVCRLAVPNTLTVQFQRATADNAWADPVNVANVIQRAPTEEEVEMFPDVRAVFHLWAADLPPGVAPKKKDRITVPAGGQYQALEVFTQAFGQRYRCLTFQENF